MSRNPTILILAAFVGTLLAIAIPNFIRARSTPSLQVCVSNLRQIDAAAALMDLEMNKNRITAATDAFIRDRRAQGISVPPTVTFGQLVSGGYFANTDVAAFTNSEVTVSLNIPKTRPESIWIRVRFSDGFQITQLADGKFTSAKYVSKPSN